jgi:N-acetylglutamate synthase-like GNAT family acetyltransferase
MGYRIATTGDVNAISDLVNSAYRGESSKKGWTTEADFLGGQRTDPNKIREMILSDNVVILIKIDSASEQARACVHLEKKDSQTAYLGMLTVNPLEQAKGTGRELLQVSEDFVHKTWECKMIEMTVINLRSELIEWYERRGYKKTGEQRDFPMNDKDFGLPKRTDFHFVVLTKNL